MYKILIRSTTISTAGVYNVNFQIAYNYQVNNPLDNIINYAISTSSTGFDSNAVYSRFTAGSTNMNYSSYSGIANLTNRRILCISSSTTVYISGQYLSGLKYVKNKNLYNLYPCIIFINK